MELRHLRYFVAVADASNFTKASERLRVAQPALSRQVQDLEEEIGVDLLKRSSRGVVLTAEGKLFFQEATEILQRADEAVKHVRALARGEYGELNIGYAPTPTLEILPPALQAFGKSASGVTVRLHDMAGDDLCAGLRDGTLQVAVMVKPSAESAAGISFEELRSYRYGIVVPRGHALARLRVVPVERVAKEPLVALRRRDYSEYYRILKEIFAPCGVRPRIAVECDGANSLITEVEIGRGVAVVSEIFQRAAGKRLVFRPLQNTTVAHRVGIAHLEEGDITPAGEKFCAALRRAAAKS